MDTINSNNPAKNLFRNDIVFLFYLAIVKLLIHFTVNLIGGYGYFRDEFYYIACSDHMAWGYVDQPPLSIAILWLNRFLFGDSLFALRLLPAVAGSIVVVLAGLITKELGGRRFAQILAACSVIAAPLLIAFNSIYSMNSFDILFWTLAFYLLILIMKRDEQKRWLLLGLVLGLGLLNKISMLWFGAGLAVGLLVTHNRKLLLTRRVWLTAGIAFILFLPHVVWQVVNDFPTLEFIKNATENKYVAVNPLEMFLQQARFMNPATLLIWCSGLIYFLVSKQSKQFRILPILYLAVFFILVINKNSKAEYLGAMFPMLFAIGAVAVEKFILKFNCRWLKPVLLALIVLVGIVLTPMAIAVLPVETFIAYSQAIGITPSTPEKKEVGKLPQFYADMFGWEKMAIAVADAYNTLTIEEKMKCVFIGNNYGEAGAIDFFRSNYALPKAISGHNNYWLWGPCNSNGEVIIRLGGSVEAMKKSYSEVIPAGLFKDDYCMPYENNQIVWICKNRRLPLKDNWTKFKNYN